MKIETRVLLGPDRILWGSDRYGVGGEWDRVHDWRIQVSELASTTGFPDDDIELLLGGNARRLFLTDAPPPPTVPDLPGAFTGGVLR